MYRLTAACLAVICIFIVRIDAAAAFKNTKIGTVSHDFALNSIDGASVRLADTRGERATIVVFWATWNPRSLIALRDMQKLHAEFADKGLVVLSVNVDGEGCGEARRSAVSKIVNDLGLRYPVLIDEDLTVYDTYGVTAVPSIALTGPEGAVTEVLNGYARASSEVFHQKVLAALEGASPGPAEESASNEAPETGGKAEKYLRMGRLFQNKGRAKDAIRYFSLAVAEDPSHREACEVLAVALQRVGKMDEAARVLAQSISLAAR